MEYTIEITEYCPHNCEYCSSDATPDGKPLDISVIKEYLRLRNAKAGDRINISGGEPLSHPQFWEILQHCKSITTDVWVYTNALSQIRHNTSVTPEITVEANVCLVPGKPAYIPVNASKVHLLQLIPQGRAKGMKAANIHVSGNLRSGCQDCNNSVLMANGIIAEAPCKKGCKQTSEGGEE